MVGDSITTDHISPAGAIRPDSPAGRYLLERGVEQRDFNSYGARRGNHEVMMRGTFANARLRNGLAPGHRGSVDDPLPERRGHERLRRRDAVRGGGDTARHLGRQGVRERVVARLGREGPRAPRRALRAGRVLRTDPPAEPRRDGHPSAPVRDRGVGGEPRALRRGDVRDPRSGDRDHAGARRDGAGHPPRTGRRTRSRSGSGSTRRPRWRSSATAGSLPMVLRDALAEP